MERTRTIAEVMSSLSTSPNDVAQITPDVPTTPALFRPTPIGNANASLLRPTTPAVKKDYEFNIEKSLIYDTDSSGNMIAKFENYKGNFGNENRLAGEQSGFEQALNGIGKFFGKTIAYAGDSVIGTIYGIGQAITEGDWDKMWDNDFSNMVDDINQQMDYSLPNYYSDEQKSMGFLRSMGTANFWFNDVGNGLAFVAGALLPTIVTSALTGGATAPKLGVDLAKMGAKLGFTTGKQAATNGRQIYRAFNYARFGDKAQDYANTALFLARTSNFEAGMEARHNFKQAMTTYISEFQSKNGRMPTRQELSTFTEQARSAANGVYVANLGILAVSNSLMFGKLLGAKSLALPRTKVGRAFMNARGLGTTKSATGEITQKALTRGAKIRGTAYNFTKPLVTEGLYEEGLQGVIGTTMQNYLAAKYDPDNDSLDLMSNLTDAFAHQYGSKEGWKEMGIGMIIGVLGGSIGRGNNVTGISPYKGFRENYSVKTQYANVTEAVERANEGRNDLMDSYNNANVMANFKSENEDLGSASIEDAMKMMAYIKSQKHVFSKGAMGVHFDSIIDAHEFTEEQIESIGGVERIDAYKQQQKEQFATILDKYNRSSKAVKALKLDQLEMTRGNRLALADNFETMFTMGLTGDEVAQGIGEKIDELMGETGSYSALTLYSTLKQKKGNSLLRYNQAVQELQQVQRTLEKGLEVPISSTDSQKAAIAEKRVLAQRRVAELQQEIEDLTTDLNSFRAVNTFDAAGLKEDLVSEETVEQALQKYNDINNFVDVLERQGRKDAANNLRFLLNQHDTYSQLYRETIKLSNDMLDTNFFNTKKGKGLTSRFLGKRFKIDDATRELIKENDIEVARQLNGLGIAIEDIEAIDVSVEKLIDENESLSDRDKYRLTSLLRLSLSVEALNNKIDNFVTESTAEPSTSTAIPAGDTLRTTLTVEGETELDRLNELINQINQELNRVRSADPDVNKFKNKLQKVSELTREKKQLQGQKLTDAVSKRLSDINAELQELDKVDLENKNPRIDEVKKLIKELEAEQVRLFTEEMTEGIDNSEFTQQVQKDLIKYNEELAKIDPLSGIIESDDYKRLEELTKKRMNADISPYEQDELDQLEERIDEWQYLTGSIVEGHRLSDLVKARIFLQNAKVAETVDIEIQSEEDTIASSQFAFTPKAANMDLGQTYDAATVRVYDKDKRFLEVNGISLEDFSRLAEVEEDEVEVSPDGRNNLLVPIELAEELNQSGKVKLIPNNGNISSSYSVVLHEKETPEGTVLEPIESTYRDAEEWNGATMNPEAIYNMVENDSVVLVFDAKDKYNKTLKSLKDFQEKGVIKVYTKEGDFVAVMKGISEFSTKSKKDIDIENFRRAIITSDLVSAAKKSSQVINLPQRSNVKVGKVLLGHVNFNYQSENGQLITTEKPITAKDLDNIVDIGYIEKGKLITKNGTSPRTTFFNRTISRKINSKVPFIVVKKGEQTFALPVNTPTAEALDTQAFFDVLSSSLSQTDKALTLNKMFLDEGYDVIERDNAFKGYGASNLTEAKLNSMLEELNANPRYNAIDTWTDVNVSIEEALQGSTVSFDISNSLHSPKIKLDFENIEDLNVEEEKFDDNKVAEAFNNVVEGQYALSNTDFFNAIIEKAVDLNVNEKLRGSKLMTKLASFVEQQTNKEVTKEEVLEFSKEILNGVKTPKMSKTTSSSLESFLEKLKKEKPC